MQNRREDVREQIVRRAAAGDFFERGARLLQIGQHEFFRQRAAVRAAPRRARASAPRARARTSAMCRTFVIAGRSRSRSTSSAPTIAAPQFVEPGAGRRRHGTTRASVASTPARQVDSCLRRQDVLLSHRSRRRIVASSGRDPIHHDEHQIGDRRRACARARTPSRFDGVVASRAGPPCRPA